MRCSPVLHHNARIFFVIDDENDGRTSIFVKTEMSARCWAERHSGNFFLLYQLPTFVLLAAELIVDWFCHKMYNLGC